MSEQSIILLGGKPGSGKSRLGNSLAHTLNHNIHTAEHISIGDRIRAIASAALYSIHKESVEEHMQRNPLEPLDTTLIHDIIYEQLAAHSSANTILLDGYPRYNNEQHQQVASVIDLAVQYNRRIKGMLVTDIDDPTALSRILKRSEHREIERIQALARIATHKREFPAVIDAINEHNIPIEYIQTESSKERTLDTALVYATRMLQLPSRQTNVS